MNVGAVFEAEHCTTFAPVILSMIASDMPEAAAPITACTPLASTRSADCWATA